MKACHSATVPTAVSVRGSGRADGVWGNGPLLASLGVVAFSLSFPGTVFALGRFGPWTATGLRGTIAAALAGTALLWARPCPPVTTGWGSPWWYSAAPCASPC